MAGGAVTQKVALTVPVVGSIKRLVALSEGLAQSDAGFARQVLVMGSAVHFGEE